MTDPKRWLDEGGGASGAERELLDVAQKSEMPAGMRARVWAGIASGAAGLGAAGAAEAAGTLVVRKGLLSLLTSSTLGKGGVAVVVAGGLSFGAMAMRAPSRQASIACPPSTLPSVVESPPPSLLLNHETSNDESVGAAVADRVPTTPLSASRVRVVAPSHDVSPSGEKDKASHESAKPQQTPLEAPSTSRLREETAAVLAIRKTLLAGHADEALRMLDRAAREFPQGVLVEEREALAVRALVGSGRRDLAEQRGTAFLQAFPRSPHASDVRALLGR